MATIKRQIIYNTGHFVWLCWINREGILWCYLHIVAPHGLYPGERRILIDQKMSAVSGRNIYIGCMIIEYYRYTYIFGKEFWNPLEPPQFYHGWDPINFYGWFMTLLNSWPRQTGKIALPLLARPWFQNCSVARKIPNLYGLKMAYKHRTKFGDFPAGHVWWQSSMGSCLSEIRLWDPSIFHLQDWKWNW
jgi:hypothetical protein